METTHTNKHEWMITFYYITYLRTMVHVHLPSHTAAILVLYPSGSAITVKSFIEQKSEIVATNQPQLKWNAPW